MYLLDEGLADLHGTPLRLLARGGGHSACLVVYQADRGGVCGGFRGDSRNLEVELLEASHAAALHFIHLSAALFVAF